MMSNTRRAVGILGVVALSGTVLAGCGSSNAAEAGGGGTTITFVGYGGDGQKAMVEKWQDPYAATHQGVTFVNTSPPDVAQVKAQVESNSVTWDVIATAPAAAEQNCGTLFEPLTFTGLKTDELVDQAVGKCYIGNFVLSTPFAYRTDAFPDPSKAPKTIADFFDVKKFPGQRGILTQMQNGILEYPLLADGVAPKDLYPLDVDRSLAKLDTIRKNTTFAPNVGALQQAISSKQVDLFLQADSRLVPAMDDGMDITIVWDKTVTSLNAFAVPKGSKNLKATEDFMQFVTTAGPAAGLPEVLGVSPINKNATPKLSENANKVAAFDPSVNPGMTVMQDVSWYAKNYNEVTAELTNWLAG